MKKLIITGDDFGLSLPVNEAIEEAHRRGILTTASLMVGAEATADAVKRAKRLSSLRVGLHLVLADGCPVSPREAVPDLLTENGEFSSHLVRTGIQYFFQPTVRRQLEREIRAQFKAFQDTGLPLDHVNSHHHMHLHPTVFGLILKVGRAYQLKAVRLPNEPPLPSWRASKKGLPRRLMAWLCLYPWVALSRARLKRVGLHYNNFVFGMNDSGCMRPDLTLHFLRFLPPGVSEIYFHPGDNADELEALTDPAVMEALLASPIETIGFNGL